MFTQVTMLTTDLGHAAAAAGSPLRQTLALMRVGRRAVQPDAVLLRKTEAGQAVAAVAARVCHRVRRQPQAAQPAQACKRRFNAAASSLLTLSRVCLPARGCPACC